MMDATQHNDPTLKGFRFRKACAAWLSLPLLPRPAFALLGSSSSAGWEDTSRDCAGADAAVRSTDKPLEAFMPTTMRAPCTHA